MDEETKKTENNSETPPQGTPASELEQCTKERDEYLNGWKRAKADLINYQKDESKRLETFAKFAALGLIEDFIPVLDSFDLALSVMEKNGTAEKGVYMIRAQFEDVLKKQGLERRPFSKGVPFDPNIHESVGEMESESPPGTLAEEVERGYMLQGRVVRPMRVKLAKPIGDRV